MAVQPKIRISAEEFYELEAYKNDELVQLIDGEVVISEPPIPKHQELVIACIVLFSVIAKTKAGKVYTTPIEVYLDKENIFSLNFNRRFEYLNLFSGYNYNSFGSSRLNSLSFGGQVRPTDVLGLAMVKDISLEAHQDIRTIYSMDIMPHNNCWIFSLNYRKSIVDSRYSFNIMFNFGDDSFERYRNDYFSVKRL